MSQRLIVGTRGSALATTQTRWVIAAIKAAAPEVVVETRIITTYGDATQAANIPLSSFGQKGIFATELETALLAGEIDVAVHSMKDLAHTLPDLLCIASVPARESVADALIGGTLEGLPQGARVGTGSVRRRALLASRRPDLQLLEIRGNVDTRLRKLADGQYDAICLAVAGLRRLGLQSHITEEMDPTWFTSDPGQGALALETRADNGAVRALASLVNDKPAFAATAAERAFLAAIGGSCRTPIGAYAVMDGETISMNVMLADDSGIRRAELTGPVTEPEDLGRRAAQALLT